MVYLLIYFCAFSTNFSILAIIFKICSCLISLLNDLHIMGHQNLGPKFLNHFIGKVLKIPIWLQFIQQHFGHYAKLPKFRQLQKNKNRIWTLVKDRPDHIQYRIILGFYGLDWYFLDRNGFYRIGFRNIIKKLNEFH